MTFDHFEKAIADYHNKIKLKSSEEHKGDNNMATKQFDNSNTVSVWNKVAKSGLEYLSGVVYVGNVAYDLTLFPNDKATSEAHPTFRGKIELRTDKK